MKPKVVLITLNYNQNDYTITSIESILESDYSNFQILLIDNGSTKENIDDLVRRLPDDDRIIFEKLFPNCGYVGGINYGLEKGSTLQPDYFLILNNDTLIDVKAISELVNTAVHFDNRCIVSGKVYHFDEPNKLQYIGSRLINTNTLEFERIGNNEIDEGKYDQVVERDLLDDIFWLLPKQLYQEIGGYSKFFWFNGESSDYALRAKKLNYKLIYTPDAKLWHKGSISIGGRNENPKLIYWQTQSSLILRCLHLKHKYFILYYLKTLRIIILGYIKSFVKLILGRKSNHRVINAILCGFISFNKWIIYKSENTGKTPYL